MPSSLAVRRNIWIILSMRHLTQKRIKAQVLLRIRSCAPAAHGAHRELTSAASNHKSTQFSRFGGCSWGQCVIKVHLTFLLVAIKVMLLSSLWIIQNYMFPNCSIACDLHCTRALKSSHLFWRQNWQTNWEDCSMIAAYIMFCKLLLSLERYFSGRSSRSGRFLHIPGTGWAWDCTTSSSVPFSKTAPGNKALKINWGIEHESMPPAPGLKWQNWPELQACVTERGGLLHTVLHMFLAKRCISPQILSITFMSSPV